MADQQYRYVVHVTPEMIRHSRILDILYFVDAAFGILLMLVILMTGLSAKMRNVAARVTNRRYPQTLLWLVLFTLLTWVIGFPLDYYRGRTVPLEFGLTHQTFGSWMGDQLKSLMVGLIFTLLLVPLALWAIRRFKQWWIAVWLGSIPLSIIGVIIFPLIIDPLFNKFEPFKREPLRSRLLAEATHAGIPNAEVFEVNASKQTTTMNAYVTGIGPTKRIVLYDTLLAKMDDDEIVSTMGHEMGHYVLNHIWKGLAFSIFISMIVTYLGQQMYERGLRRWGARWGGIERGDAASFPWLLVVISLILFILTPINSAFSRYQEHQADLYGLDVTGLNEASASSMVKFAEDAKINPDPPAFIEFWRYSHPAPSKRIRLALEHKPPEGKKPSS
ncbi:MAG TPA: M48 family metallopeptidase [Thermoanaerobaculia bacterium]|nr:M48 family metallopeptidase [Thermoanaerobaculia bacterium]